MEEGVEQNRVELLIKLKVPTDCPMEAMRVFWSIILNEPLENMQCKCGKKSPTMYHILAECEDEQTKKLRKKIWG